MQTTIGVGKISEQEDSTEVVANNFMKEEG